MHCLKSVTNYLCDLQQITTFNDHFLTYFLSINTKMGMIIGTYMVTFVGHFLSLWTKGNPR